MKEKLPLVAIIGRVNVGKSTLLNRLSETKRAIVSSHPGTTRDLIKMNMWWGGKHFTIVDSAGYTEEEDNTEIAKNARAQTEKIAREADAILWVIDNNVGLTGVETEIARALRKTRTPIILGINKVDTKKDRENIAPDAWKLGFEPLVTFSAKNGSGTGDLLDEIVKFLPTKKTTFDEKSLPRITIIGRPNVGKSTLLNTLASEERSIVSNTPHTTRDRQDSTVAFHGRHYQFTDTAGIRKKSRVGSLGYGSGKAGELAHIEKQSIQQALDALPESDIIILMVDAVNGINLQDKKIGALLEHQTLPVIIAVNKWDAVPDKTATTLYEYEKTVRNIFPHLSYAPILFISARDKIRITDIFQKIDEVLDEASKRISEQALENFLKKTLKKHPVKRNVDVAQGQPKKPAHIKTLVQKSTHPTVFVIKTPHPRDIPEGWLRLIRKKMYEEFGFIGCPIQVITDK